MSVEFDPISQDEQPDGLPPVRTSHRRQWTVAVCAGAAIVLLGGGAVALAQTSASASTTPSAYASRGEGGQGGEGGPGPGGTRPTGPRTPHLDGTVKSVSGTTILITDMDGFTRTIVTSSKTVYKDSLTASPKAGTKIDAEGTVDSNGTSLDATVIQTPPAGGMGHGGPGGPGGSGGERGSGTRPSGAPTGARPTAAPSTSAS